MALNDCADDATNTSCTCSFGYSSQNDVQLQFRQLVEFPLIVVGVVANAVTVAVFLHVRMRRQTLNWYVLTLSSNNVLFLLLTFWFHVFPVWAETSGRLELMELGALVMRWFYPLMKIGQMVNVYCLVVLSLHLHIGICHPFRAKQWLTRQTVLRAILGVVVAALLFNTPRFFELTLVRCVVYNTTTLSYMMYGTALIERAPYFYGYRVVVYSLVIFLLPFGALLGVNGPTARTLGRAPPADLAPRRSSRQLQHERANGRMFLVIVGKFLVCNSVSFLNNVLEIALHVDFQLAELFGSLVVTAVECGNVLVVLGMASTPLVLAAYMRKYRLVFADIFCCRRRLDSQRRSLPLANDSAAAPTPVRPAGHSDLGCFDSNSDMSSAKKRASYQEHNLLLVEEPSALNTRAIYRASLNSDKLL